MESGHRHVGISRLFVCARDQRAGQKGLTGQLIDAATGAHLWAGRFDGPLDDIFELQDQVTSSVVNAIAPKLEQAEIERAKRKPTENLDAYDHFLRGMSVLNLWTRHSNHEATNSFCCAYKKAPSRSDRGLPAPPGTEGRDPRKGRPTVTGLAYL